MDALVGAKRDNRGFAARHYKEYRALRAIEIACIKNDSEITFKNFLRKLSRIDGNDANGQLAHSTVHEYVHEKTRKAQLVPYVDGYYETHREIPIVRGYTLAVLENFACFTDTYARKRKQPLVTMGADLNEALVEIDDA